MLEMKLLSLSLWFSYLFVNLAINETYGHPKSWLTTTERPRPKAKPKRSVSKVDVTYYPGLTGEYKDALRFEELRKFLQEEEEEAEGEEEVIIRLLQEEHESRTEEPIEFAVQKRVMMQLRNSQLKETIDIIEFPDESFVYETLRDSTHGNNDYLESTKYTIEDGKPQKHEKTSKSGYDLRIDSVPDAMVKRLLSGESTSSEKHHDASQFHQQYINTSGNHPLRHDVDVHLRHRQNFDHDTRQDVLLQRLLKRQHQINTDDLEFLTASNNGEIETNSNHTITSGEVEPDGDDVISEAQLDWEEYHEYDA